MLLRLEESDKLVVCVNTSLNSSMWKRSRLCTAGYGGKSMSVSSALNREARFRRLPSVAVDVPFLEVFRIRVGYGLEQTGLVKNCPCPMARGWSAMSSKVPFNSNHLKIL